MSITDELREYADEYECSSYRKMLTAIADRIDAEHEQQCAESWMRGHDAWAAIDRSDEMAEQLDTAERNRVRNAREYARLCHENDRLRELVRTIYMCSNIRCGHCEYRQGNTCAFDAEAELNELGIEVEP